ncbi:hypothetical protein O6H91_09G073700 [Diphasiastrum complanatum]|uniref:Uncharacterized protein n=1 Tax=Diphasiastrum complanatum TaxID=34168 RepID=A0ACC2CQZ8_DIPCM|nr:hypothetical protein O6H91_09G073700 [Diphasiastrum complanatum]
MAMAMAMRGVMVLVGMVVMAIMSQKIRAQFPIPARYDGFVYTQRSLPNPVLLEAFFDPLCPDSRDAWPVIKKLVEYYGTDLELILHTFPLPYHHNSFFSARALHIVNRLNASLTYPLLELIFENQEIFSNSFTLQETPASVIDRLISLAARTYGQHLESGFESGFNDPSTDQATRISFKYACSRAVTGTPMFFVNGVNVQGADQGWSYSDWRNLLDPIVNDNGNETAKF